MAAATTFSFHVQGPVVPACNIGSASAYVGIGVCEDGADIDLQVATHPIKHDGGGGPDGFEVDDIFLSMIATIRFTLVPFGGIYVNILRAMAQAGAYTLNTSGTDGLMVMPGTLYGENTKYVGLSLPVLAGEGDGPWWFRTCRVVRPGSVKVSTKETKPQFEFRAINYFAISGANTISGNTLYSRTAAS